MWHKDVLFRPGKSVFLLLVYLFACASCSEAPTDVYQGYVEGEFVYVGSPIGGRLETLHVQKGQTIKKGDSLFELEHAFESFAVTEATEKYRQALEKLANLRKGKRPSEVEAIKARLKSAEADLQLARKEYQRRLKLNQREFISKESLDRAQTALSIKNQVVQEIKAELRTARLGARSDEIKAARAEADAVKAKLDQAQWNLDQKSLISDRNGLVFDILYYKGEWVPSGRPVMSLLTPENIKVRFFVPETVLGRLALGQPVSVSLDGGDTLSARISFISPQAEYTPPVIYSSQTRSKLVFLIEATAEPEKARLLHPGQPVDVKESVGRGDSNG